MSLEGGEALNFELTDDAPVYVISVAAQLSGLHPQTLRAYDRLGLVSPGRAVGRGRRYSLRDVLALREVQRLSQVEGVNLSGIKRILELERSEERSRARLAELHAEIAQLRAELESTRAVAARLASLLRGRNEEAALVPVRHADSPAARPQPAAPQPAARADAGAAGTGPAGTGPTSTGPTSTGPTSTRPASSRPPIALPAATLQETTHDG
jgi:MerR family transcriptional regulator, heat shock protein HspR